MTSPSSASPSPTESLIPRQLLFGNPDRTMARVSPDGRHISYLAPLDGVLNVWVAPVDNLADARAVTADSGRGIRSYTWPYSGKHLLYVQDKGGDENWRIYSVDLDTDETRDLTPFDEVQAQITGISPSFPDEILVGLNNRNPQLHDLHRINLMSGEMELVHENEGFVSFIVDQSFAVRLGAQMNADGSIDFLERAEGEWKPFLHVDVDDTLTTQPLGYNAAGDTLYLIDSRGRDTAAFTIISSDGGVGAEGGSAADAAVVLAADDRADASGVMMHPVTKQVEAVSFTYARVEWTVLDDSIQNDLDFLATVADGEVDVVDRSLADDVWIVAYTMANGPVRYYRYDRSVDGPPTVDGSVEFLFSSRSALEDLTLANMHSVVIKARDGLDMVGYYSLPSWHGDGSADAPRPAEPLPTVLVVHGGPWARDNWGYNPIHQLLANRGYAVISVNFRSSTGFGKSFINAGNLEWGAKMHDDLLDTVDWAVEAGIADRDRVAIMGGSYGGYATLAGLTFTPDVFACGVDIVGPSNLNTLLDSVPEYWRPMIEMMYTRVGDPTTDDGAAMLAERSPLTHADKIQRPLLIGQGANDPRVKQAESDQIVDAMTAKGIPVTYVLYPDEGHGFARPENNLSFFAVAEVFLARHLSTDRTEPLPSSFPGSSIEVPVGATGVTGLTEALPS